MKKHIPRILILAAISGFIALAPTVNRAQTADPLLADETDQSDFPQITAQPVDQAVPLGSNIVMSVQAANADGFQWLRNGVPVDGQTNCSLVIPNAGVKDVGLYSCTVSKSNGESVPTRTANLNVVAASSGAVAASLPANGPITIYGTPVLNGGSSGNDCPGAYAGYVTFTKTASQGWGWAPAAGMAHIATDTNRLDTKVEYVGRSGDEGCAQTSVSIPDPTFSTKYRFTIYFPNNVPTGIYSITLNGFN